MYDEPAHHRSSSQGSYDTAAGVPDAEVQNPDLPERCSHCGRPLDGEEGALLLMRDGRAVAAYHDRCHPHHRRSGCSAC